VLRRRDGRTGRADIVDPAGHVLVTAYALQRPDGQWSLLLINKDQQNAHQVRIVFHDREAAADRHYAGSATMITFGRAVSVAWERSRRRPSIACLGGMLPDRTRPLRKTAQSRPL
jgi:hypothetical protein